LGWGGEGGGNYQNIYCRCHGAAEQTDIVCTVGVCSIIPRKEFGGGLWAAASPALKKWGGPKKKYLMKFFNEQFTS